MGKKTYLKNNNSLITDFSFNNNEDIKKANCSSINDIKPANLNETTYPGVTNNLNLNFEKSINTNQIINLGNNLDICESKKSQSICTEDNQEELRKKIHFNVSPKQIDIDDFFKTYQ